MKNLIFRNRIRMYRAERSYTQKDLAEEVCVSRQTIHNIEKMEFVPSARLAFLICMVLDHTFEEVFYFTEE